MLLEFPENLVEQNQEICHICVQCVQHHWHLTTYTDCLYFLLDQCTPQKLTVAFVTRKTESWLKWGRSGELFMIVLILATGNWVSFPAPLSELVLSAILDSINWSNSTSWSAVENLLVPQSHAADMQRMNSFFSTRSMLGIVAIEV